MNFKIGDRIFVRGYIDEIRKDTVIVRNDGGYFGTILSEVITGELPSAQPVRHGVWKKIRGTINCSACKSCSWSMSFEDLVTSFNYCPNCGAKMGEEDGHSE